MNIISFLQRKILLVLVFLFLFTRFYNLTLLPIFTDEAVYIYWAKYISAYHTHWFMSLTDGKPPLFIWVIAFFLKFFPGSWYLFVGRFVSVLAGLITLFGIYKVSSALFNSKKIAYLSSLLYILTPFTLFYDRLALIDSFLSSVLIWAVYFMVKTSQTLQKKDAIWWGIFLGIAFLFKPPAIIFLLLTPLCFLILVDKKNILRRKKGISILIGLPILIGEIINNLQKLSENYHLLEIKNQQFQITFSDLISHPFLLFFKNLQEMTGWIISYYTVPILLLGVLGLFVLFLKNTRKGIALLVLWLTPIIIFALVGKIIFSRYILFTTPYFLIMVAYCMQRFKVNIKILLIIVLFFPFIFDFYILTDPTKASLPKTDYSQYITSEYSGYGLDKIFNYLDKELANGPQIMLVTQGKFGLFPYAFKLRYWDDKRMQFYQAWLSDNILDVDVYKFQLSAKVYIVMWQNDTIPQNYPFRLVLESKKPDGKHPILLSTPKEKQ